MGTYFEDVRYTNSDEWVPLGLGQFRVRSAFEAWVPREMLDGPHGARLSVTFDAPTRDWIVEEFAALAWLDDREVSTESLRSMGVEHALRQAVHSIDPLVVDAAGVDWRMGLHSRIAELTQRRQDGPTPQNLDQLALVYTISRLYRQHPVRGVMITFGLAQSTATHWVKLARERGNLAV